MALISFSIFTIAKGAIALSKYAGVKAFIVKNGATIIGKMGVDGALAAGVTVAGAAGVAVTVASIPQNTKEAFSKIVRGILENKSSELFDGIYKLYSVYSTADGFITDFNNYVQDLDLNNEDKVAINVTVKEVTQVLLDHIEGTAYNSLRQFEAKLRISQLTEDSYKKITDDIYKEHTKDVWDNYSIILGRAGRIYADMSEFNRTHKLLDDNTFDHYLVFCIAGWFLNNYGNYNCLKNKNQELLAHDVTDNILSYLKSIGK